MLKIGVVDCCSATRKGLKLILSQHPQLVVLWDTGDYTEIFELLSKKPVKVLILDMEAAGRGRGLDLVCKIRSAFPQVAHLIYTSPSEEGWACEALRAGAAAFLPKNASERELLRAIQKIATDGIYLTETQMEFLALRNLRNPNSKPWWELLSNREKAIIQLIAAGSTIKEIANELGLSSSTVATYRARMLQKLGVKSDADLVRIVDGHVSTLGNGESSHFKQALSDMHPVAAMDQD